MKFGFRTPNLKKSIKARTTGRIKRMAKSAVNPLYGKKGMGYINNPKKAIYNKIYNKTSFGISDTLKYITHKKEKINNNQKNISLTNIEQELNTIKKLSYLVNTSNDPKVFFIKYEEMILKLGELAKVEGKYKFSNRLPSENLKEILQKRVDTINDFIFRYYSVTRIKIDSLKQRKSKDTYIEEFKNSLDANIRYMDNINIDRFNRMYETLKKDCI